MPATSTYIVEIEYVCKKTVEVEALSNQWAEIVVKEKWESERPEEIISISASDKD